MTRVPTYLLQRSIASIMLDISKMKAFTPCEVESRRKSFKARMTEVVFDPLRIEGVNDKFKAAGYNVPGNSKVIAVTEDGTLLVWGGANSVFHLPKGAEIDGLHDNVAFDNISDLTRLFKTKSTKVEIDTLITQLQEKYTPTK